jgi:hypothetical protein
MTLAHQRGNRRAYTLDRLKRNNPELFAKVVNGELSANAAAIEAGFRKKLSALEQIRKLIPKLTAEDCDFLAGELYAVRQRFRLESQSGTAQNSWHMPL